jgi:hypothetical protein
MVPTRWHVPAHFTHSAFRVYGFEDLPRNRDVFLMDDCWLEEYESAFLDLFHGKDFRNVGYISYAAVRNIGPESLQISWYPNRFDRFHEVTIDLPRENFIVCVEVPDRDEKPHIFVKSGWIADLHLRPYSAFALVDAIGVKKAMVAGEFSDGRLVQLRNRIDGIAAQNPAIAFVSFADSLLLKVNYSIGQYDSPINYSYEPELLIKLMPKIAEAYRDLLGMSVYSIIAQGKNEYVDPVLLHTSASGNHVSLNSLGHPFAQLLAIDAAVRVALREGTHPPTELYIDEHYYFSLRFKRGFDRHRQVNAEYVSPISGVAQYYFCASVRTILENLEPIRDSTR